MTRSLPYYREVCVDTLEDAIQAEMNGADQIELCSRLDLDGLTPSQELLEQAFSKIKIPIKPMLRLRGGDFVYTRQEKDAMLHTLEILKQFDCKSIVFGARAVLRIFLLDNAPPQVIHLLVLLLLKLCV